MEKEVYLKDYQNFVKIDKTFYGGDQTWLFRKNHIPKFWANRACGLVAVSNALCYLFRDQYPSITKESYTALAMELYPFLKPKVYGIPTVGIIIKALNKYALSINHKLIPNPLINPNNITSVITYIKNALQEDYPVMMVTLNTKNKDLRYHWVTITGYYKSRSGENFIVTSNWGNKSVYNLDQWVEERSFYKGLLWFKLKGLKNDYLR